MEGRSHMLNEITCDAVVDNIEKVTAFVDALLEEFGCPMKKHRQIDVAIDELFANIANYAYASGTGWVTIRVELEENPRAVALTFIDAGKPYNPLSEPEPDVTLAVEDRAIGGLGIFLVKRLMDEVSYSYQDGKNVLLIRKFM